MSNTPPSASPAEGKAETNSAAETPIVEQIPSEEEVPPKQVATEPETAEFVSSENVSNGDGANNSDLTRVAEQLAAEITTITTPVESDITILDEAIAVAPEVEIDDPLPAQADSAQQIETTLQQDAPDTSYDPVEEVVSQKGSFLSEPESDIGTPDLGEQRENNQLDTDRFLSLMQPEPMIMVNNAFLEILPKIKPDASADFTESLTDAESTPLNEIVEPTLEEASPSENEIVGKGVAIDKAYFFEATHKALRGNVVNQGDDVVIAVLHGENDKQLLRFPFKVMPYNWIASAPQPSYPESCARDARKKETVTVQFKVDGRGRAPKPLVTSATNPCFADAAQSNIRDMQFRVRAAPGYAFGGSDFLMSIVFDKPTVLAEE